MVARIKVIDENICQSFLFYGLHKIRFFIEIIKYKVTGWVWSMVVKRDGYWMRSIDKNKFKIRWRNGRARSSEPVDRLWVDEWFGLRMIFLNRQWWDKWIWVYRECDTERGACFWMHYDSVFEHDPGYMYIVQATATFWKNQKVNK